MTTFLVQAGLRGRDGSGMALLAERAMAGWSQHPPISLPVALFAAAASGPVMAAAFPSLSWWPTLFPGLALLLVALIGRRPRTALLLGYVAGVSFWAFQIEWTARYLGPVPWIALSLFEGVFFAVGCLLIACVYRWLPRLFPGALGRIGLLPLVVAGLWTAREGVTNVWPYGGFAWARLSLSQSESPFAPLVAWVGLSGLTFILAWVVALAIECVRFNGMRASMRGATAIGAIALVLAVPAWPTPTSGTVTVASVQGDGPAGYFEPHQVGDVMNAQTTENLKIIHKKVDMVVWPEGAADVDPTRDREAAAVLNYISAQMHAPLITGTITHRDGKYYNTSLLWEAGKGAVQYYDKKHPVPFGEYVPDRWLYQALAPALIDLIGRDYTPGTRPNTFDVNGVTAGISICFDIEDDQLLTDMMNGGAQVILAQTNNADFGTTEENVQQLAIARMRAIESGRSLVNISTVGTSEVIDPSGKTIDAIPAYKPGAMITTVPLGTTTTPAVVDSRGLEWFFCGLGLAGLVVGWAARKRV